MTLTPQPPKRNDPSIPTVYDSQWQFYVDLSPAQIAAYQAMPEWAAYVATQPVTDWAARAAANAAVLSAQTARGIQVAKAINAAISARKNPN